MVQDRLNARGARLAKGGRFGPVIEAAVKNFQRAHQLEVDGHDGPKTWPPSSRERFLERD